MEFAIVSWLNHLGGGTRIDKISLLISRRPFLLGIFALILGLLYWRYPQKRKQLIIALIVSLIGFYLINELAFKHVLIDYIGIRQRPYIAHPEMISQIGSQFPDSSFPSSHMASTLLIMTLVVWMFPTLRPFALIFSLLMAFSRMYNGMHYPSDVLVGSILGILYGIFGIRIGSKLKNMKILKYKLNIK